MSFSTIPEKIPLNPTIWGPLFWNTLHHIAWSYPETPNAFTKRKYYDLIQNFPLFLPDSEIGNKFAELLDRHPITPYLDSRASFIRWMHYIHNKVNVSLGKDEMSFLESLNHFKEQYKPKYVKIAEKFHIQKHWIYAVLIVLALIFIYYSW
jgi:hypothetical protein